MGNITCSKCGETKWHTEFWLRHGEPDDGTGVRYDKCKDCCCEEIKEDSDALIKLFEELDAPFFKRDWKLINEIFTLTTRQKISRYLSKMRLKSYRNFRFSDSEEINKIHEEQEREAMRRRGFNV